MDERTEENLATRRMTKGMMTVMTTINLARRNGGKDHVRRTRKTKKKKIKMKRKKRIKRDKGRRRRRRKRRVKSKQMIQRQLKPMSQNLFLKVQNLCCLHQPLPIFKLQDQNAYFHNNFRQTMNVF
jgi:hypothetical protein